MPCSTLNSSISVLDDDEGGGGGGGGEEEDPADAE
jgi:hypothetical protein